MPVKLIGGPDLLKMIALVELGERLPQDKIALSVDDHIVSSHNLGLGVDDPMRRRALECIRTDLKAKSLKTTGFVSIRLHVGLNLFRLVPGEEPICLSMAPEIDSLFTPENAAKGIVLQPHEFAVCLCLERLSLPSHVDAFVQSRTTVALQGIDVTPTSQIVPGFKGPVMLEMRNMTDRTVQIPPFFALAEVFFSDVGGSYSGLAENYAKVAQDIAGPVAGPRMSVKTAKYIQVGLFNLFAIIVLIVTAGVMRVVAPGLDLLQIAPTIIFMFVVVMMFSLRSAGLLSEKRFMEWIRMQFDRKKGASKSPLPGKESAKNDIQKKRKKP
jgi:deoxycytidine triphosphate deaminase